MTEIEYLGYNGLPLTKEQYNEHILHNMDLRIWEDGWSIYCHTCKGLVMDSEGRRLVLLRLQGGSTQKRLIGFDS